MSGRGTNHTKRTGRKDSPTTNRAGSKDGTDHGRMYGCMDRPVDGPPRGPNLSLQKFQEGTDDMDTFLDTFEATVTAGRWPRDQWPLFLRGSLSGAGLKAVAEMTATRQADYDVVKNKLQREYHISTETFRMCVFDTPFVSAHTDGWLSHHRHNFQQWIAS